MIFAVCFGPLLVVEAEAGIFQRIHARRVARGVNIFGRRDRQPQPIPQPYVNPAPIPTPLPLPAPAPQPKPLPAPGYRVLLVVPPNWYSTASPRQAAILADPAVRTYLNGTFPANYRFYLTTTPPATMPEPFATYFAAGLKEGHAGPWLWLFDPSGKAVLSEALPADAKTALDDLQKAKGK